jgi:hypothetical protein
MIRLTGQRSLQAAEPESEPTGVLTCAAGQRPRRGRGFRRGASVPAMAQAQRSGACRRGLRPSSAAAALGSPLAPGLAPAPDSGPRRRRPEPAARAPPGTQAGSLAAWAGNLDSKHDLASAVCTVSLRESAQTRMPRRPRSLRASEATGQCRRTCTRLSELEPTTGLQHSPNFAGNLIDALWQAPSGLLLLAVRLHPRKFLHVPNR